MWAMYVVVFGFCAALCIPTAEFRITVSEFLFAGCAGVRIIPKERHCALLQ